MIAPTPAPTAPPRNAPTAPIGRAVSIAEGQLGGPRAVLIILSGHVNEHLGQEVAYARSNKVTPPWSEGKPEGKPEAKAPEAKK